MKVKVWQLIKLSRIAEKKYRLHKNKFTNQYEYHSKWFNGVHHIDGKTYVSNGVWFFEIDGIIEHEELRVSSKEPTQNVFQLMWEDDLDEVEINIENLIPKDNYLTLKLGKSYFDSDLLFNQVFSMFKNPKLMINKQDINQYLQISEGGIKCIVAPLHETIRGESHGV